MNIDLTKYTEKELIELNRKVVERVKYLRTRKAHQAMDNFKLGDTVCFEQECGHFINGRIIKFNQKTVSMLTDDGHKYNIPPQHLKKVVETKIAQKKMINEHPASQNNVIVMGAPASDSVSRNAPCPCGSGKKYKRCCLAN